MQTVQSRRRLILAATALLPPLVLIGRSAVAQRNIDVARIVVGYPAGGSLDVISRKLAERLAGTYAKSVIVENRTGASGRIAVETVKASRADGSVLLITPGSILTMYPHIYKQLAYDPTRDLRPVSVVATTEFALAVGPKVPGEVQRLEDFLRWCRRNPSTASCGNAGMGSFPHFLALLLASESGVQLNHVPYRGGLPAMTAAAGGEIAAALATESAALALERGGRLRVIATSGTKRSANFPNALTFEEQAFPKLTQREWFGSFLPGTASDDAAEALSRQLLDILNQADIVEMWKQNGLTAISSTPAELQRAIRNESDFWAPIIRSSGFTPAS